MPDVIYRERIIATDPRLRRIVNHDSRSRRYPFRTEGITLTSVKHARHVNVFDQGMLGSCTGNAGVGCLATDPFYLTRLGSYSLDQAGAVRLYSDATRIDPFDGTYPPEDTGSDGLSIAKALTAAGEISGYQWTFTLEDALKALVVTPYITGTYWLDDMFEPDSTGRVQATGAVAGGHEYLADELDVERERIWFTNSWGPDWGAGGRFWMSWDDYGDLLDRQGDVTIFVSRTLPPPEPEPIPEPAPVVTDPLDVDLAQKLRGWATRRHYRCSNQKAAEAVRQWIRDKGL